ncbi:amidoligase family protein [Desulfonatronum sp. SC1]|uniref:amidoligase family protein n=1 Tax=Desulfonatronum sp. SC1 TaxID=2109626 RepID=UPI000D319525|nr:amidoligase family protein [Desulfonatronum sp. SC1]PTN35322.1 amidoligase enzyme [Desulfonatronum sp. SC1]
MPRFILPDQMHTPDCEVRRVGVEMEMAGLELPVMAQAVKDLFGGHIDSKSPFEIHVLETRHGAFAVELDASLLKNHEYQPYLAKVGIDLDARGDQQTFDAMLARLAAGVVPSEVVAPPIPVMVLEDMDALRDRLRRDGAKGTRTALVYAFGAQFNVEAVRLDAAYLRNILRAYVLLHDRLTERGAVDLSRKISPYIRAFPGGYVRLLLNKDYTPDLPDLIRDYLLHNPTRNRPLDMLPLFAHLERDLVMNAPVETHLIKPRPAFHYRLPNCQIDESDWSLAKPWNDWIMVEKLAADENRLREHARAYLEKPGEVVARMVDEWVDMLGTWLKR